MNDDWMLNLAKTLLNFSKNKFIYLNRKELNKALNGENDMPKPISGDIGGIFLYSTTAVSVWLANKILDEEM